jgi:hypothetical protein
MSGELKHFHGWDTETFWDELKFDFTNLRRRRCRAHIAQANDWKAAARCEIHDASSMMANHFGSAAGIKLVRGHSAHFSFG